MRYLMTIYPECPRCNSLRVGKTVEYTKGDPVNMMRDGIRSGELIRIVPFRGVNNCFCADCGLEWSGSVKTTLVSKEEKEELLRSRGITDNSMNEFNQMLMEQYQKTKKRSWIEKTRIVRCIKWCFNRLFGYEVREISTAVHYVSDVIKKIQND